jgi:uncharacterized damage-inducible protein DinB
MKSTLKRLDTIHRKLASTIGSADPALLYKRPAENEWSVAQVVDHLCLVEEAIINYLKSRLDKPPVKVSLIRKLLPMRIVSLRFKRLQAPEVVRPESNQPPMDALLQRYDNLRGQLTQMCIDDGERLRNVCFKHPYFGDMDGAKTVSMIAFHEQRHYKQIRETLKKLSKN